MPQDEARDTFFLPAERAEPAAVAAASQRVCREETVRHVLEVLPGPAVVLNGFRQILAANRRLLDELGLESVEAVLGQRPGEAMRCRGAVEAPGGCGTGKRCAYCGCVSAIRKSLQTDRTETAECRIARVDGAALDLEVSATPTLLDDMPVVFVALRDISAEKRREVLERTFFHDLLNTAGGLRGLLTMSETAESPEARARLRGSLLALADDLITEIRNHRQLCEAEEGNLELSTSTVRAPRIVEDVGLLYLSHEAAQGRTLALKGAPALLLETDPIILKRVLGNMVKNALEAVPEDETVTFWAEAEEDGIAFHVRNPGVMPEAVRQQVFQRSFSTKGEGRGLGTYAMKLLGERYLGGRVSFVSEPGAGTTFTLRLPARAGDGASAHAEVPAGLEVLVVDDMRLNRMILRHQLEHHGCRVAEAPDGRAALELVQARAFDLVLLDVQMPGMNGIDLAHAVRAREQDTDLHLPLVALTGYDDRGNHAACTAAGIDEILEKPVDGETLADVLGRLAARG